MTNPDNIVRVRARNGGRASVYEANGWAQAYSAGLLEGNGVKQNTSADMNVLVGGSTTKPDVVLAQNAAGYRVALDIVGQQAVAITKPASNSRISAIVAYTDDLSLGTTEDTVTGSPSTCGLIVVNGTAASSPSEPTDTQIRNAITSDGATGSQAAYCVIATILVASNTTTITDSLITNKAAKLAGTGVVSSSNIDFATLNNVTVQNLTFTCSNWNAPLANTFTIKHSSDGKIAFLSGHVSWGGTGGSGNETVTSSDTGLRPKADTSFTFFRFVTTGNLVGIAASADAVLKTNGSIVITVSKNSSFTQQDFIFDNTVLIVD